ncbi:KR domain-containing protein [Bacillus velezensis]|nr:KR domain-containing protein [Bacillus velezensis]
MQRSRSNWIFSPFFFSRLYCRNEGQCDYAYANGFLDHFAEYREQKRQNSLPATAAR